MKIGILSNSFYENTYRGIGRYTNDLFENLSKIDTDNTYYKAKNSSFVSKGTDVLIIPDFSIYKFSLPIFHNSKRVIVVIHDLIPILFPRHFPLGIRASMTWNMQKFLINKRTNWIVTDSYASEKDIKNIIRPSKDRISVVYPVVSDVFGEIKNENLSNKIAKKYNLPDDFILYVGDANWNKNVPILVKSAKEIGYNLVIVGKVFKENSTNLFHPWNKSLKEVLNLTTDAANVKLLGFVEDSDLKVIYNLSKLYIQPSIYEGFGYPVVEAMISKVPVLASNIGSIREIGEDSITYFDPENINDLNTKIKLIINNSKALDNLAVKGYKRALFFKDNRRFVDSFKYIYKKIF